MCSPPALTRVLSIGLLCFAAPPASLHAEEHPSERIVLFNGKNLDNWVVEGPDSYTQDGQPKPIWTVKDHLIHCAGVIYGWLRYDRKFTDFELHVEYRMLQKKGNSGIGIRAVPYQPALKNSPSVTGYEIQILDDPDKPPSAKSAFSLYRYIAPSAKPLKPIYEWNTVDIKCIGPRIQVTVNDEEVINIDQSEHPRIAKKPLEGYVAIQSHRSKIQFRNITLRDLSK